MSDQWTDAGLARLLNDVRKENGMPKYFTVELSWTAVVEADSEIEAYAVAEDEKHDICGDSFPDIFVGREIKSLAALPGDWDRKCLPYGGDGMSRLEDLLPEQEGDIAAREGKS